MKLNITKNIKFRKTWQLLIADFIPSLSPSYGQEKPDVQFGGALHFKYNFSSWKKCQKEWGGDFGFDLFRMNSVAAYKGVKLNAEYHLYFQGFGGGILKQDIFRKQPPALMIRI